MFAVILIFWELTVISFPVSIREGDFPFSTHGRSVHLYKMNLPGVGPREWNLSIATTPETFKLPWDWDMLSICLWNYWCPQKGWTILRWQGIVFGSSDGRMYCKSKSDQRCKVRRWYSVTLLVFYTIHSLCLAMAERREEGREGRSAPSIALGSWGQSAVFQDSFNPTYNIIFLKLLYSWKAPWWESV